MSIDGIGREFTYGEGFDLILELMRETGSHLYASMVGLDLAGTQAEQAQILHAQGWVNRHRDTKRFPKPIELPGPWPKHDPNADVSAEQRRELMDQLEARSVFRDR